MLVLVVNGNGSGRPPDTPASGGARAPARTATGSGGPPQSRVSGGDSAQLVSAYAQGAIYATNAIDLGTTSQFDGPLDGQTVLLGQSTNSYFPGFTFVPAGMPGNPEGY